MPTSQPMKTVLVTGTILSLASQAFAHMEMSWPYPLHSKYNPANSYNVIDYSMTSPLSADGSNFPCKGYQNDRPFTPVITYTAGETYNMTIAGSASHGGGSCQLSLSYDNGATFRVIKSMIGGCPLTSTYDFTIPSYVPDGDALFAWSWQNEQGNREFYMNCAQIEITGSSASSKRDTYSSFESLPFIWKANLAGINDCVTVEGDDPVYPEPGPDVQYGGDMSSSSSASSKAGVCDAPTPFGQTYEDLGDTSEPQTATVGSGSAATSAAASSVKSSAAVSSTPTTLQYSTKASSSGTTTSTTTQKVLSSSTQSTVVTLSTVNAGKSSVAAASTTASPSDDDDDDECGPDVTLTVYASSSATGASSSAAAAASSSAPVDPSTEYATGNLTTYLPCVPGSYICTSSSTWVTCDSTMYSDGSTSWVYRDARTLGSTMYCVPSFSPYSSYTKQYAQQADSPSGYYRDDRIAYSTGNSCNENGDIECQGSSGFNMCADNVWYQMGSTASGTSCSNGELVASS